jgi:hypothetical protein
LEERSVLRTKYAYKEMHPKTGDFCLLHASFLRRPFFNSEDEGDMSLRSIGWLSKEYMARYS